MLVYLILNPCEPAWVNGFSVQMLSVASSVCRYIYCDWLGGWTLCSIKCSMKLKKKNRERQQTLIAWCFSRQFGSCSLFNIWPIFVSSYLPNEMLIVEIYKHNDNATQLNLQCPLHCSVSCSSFFDNSSPTHYMHALTLLLRGHLLYVHRTAGNDLPDRGQVRQVSRKTLSWHWQSQDDHWTSWIHIFHLAFVYPWKCV